MKLLFLSFIVLFLTTLSSLMAADTSVGCGLGTMIWKQNSLVSTTSRTITNGISSNQLFGMSSGTLGCAQHSIVKAEMAPVLYAESNHEQLKIDMAQGSGETLMAFADTFGCPSDQRDNFSELTHKNYSVIFQNGNEDSHQMLDNVKQVLRSSSLKTKCPIVTI